MSVKIVAVEKPSAQDCQAKSSVMPCLHAEILSNASFIKYFINCTLKSWCDNTLPRNFAQGNVCVCVCVCTWKRFVRRQLFYKSAHVGQSYKIRKLNQKECSIKQSPGICCYYCRQMLEYRFKINLFIFYVNF
jgi:hypothetical protein